MAEKPACNPSVFSWIYGRQLGGFGKRIFGRRSCPSVPPEVDRRLWKSIWLNTSTKSRDQTRKLGCGGVFGLKYSPNGEVLVAACENECLVLMDPVTESVIELKENAHKCCCNNITFLDDRTFASCSDDCTVAVWDIRNMTSEMLTLHGHRSWVKNVEIHKPSGKLVSSAFDGTIRSWNLDAFNSEGNVESDTLLEVQGLLRMKLSPLGDSMYISSCQIDEVIGIHHLDLCNLAEDIGFLKAIETAGGLRTNKRTVIFPNLIYQNFPILERNNIDVFCRDSMKSSTYGFDHNFPCHSIDVHPRNSAILLYYMSGGDNLTAVHNTKRQYHSYAYEVEDNNKVGISLSRGLLTNYLSHEHTGSGEFIEEVSFSHCGRLIASPLGYGAVLATFDEEFSDFETCMSHQNVFKNKRKRKPTEFASMVPSVLNVVEHCLGHSSNVLSTCFSPTHIQLATGSEEGLIALHNPELGTCQTMIAP